MSDNRAYRITETLYQSHRTVIYRAVRQEDQCSMILKVLASEYPAPLELARFRQEYELVRSLDVNGIPDFEAFGKLENRYYISMQDDGSVSLRQFLEEGELSVQAFLKIAIQLSEILGHLHRKKVIHKDLKPDNIFIQEDQSKVTIHDFGFSTQIQGETSLQVMPDSWEGSLAYLSPEGSGRMNRPFDYRSDFYALGISFFEMLTGCLPYYADGPLEWMHIHLARALPDPRNIRGDIPEMLVQIIKKLAAKMMEDRYQSASGLQSDLEKCLAQWQASGTIKPFQLGAQDLSYTFRIPAKIYGREKEIAALSKTIQQITQKGQTELVLVSGYPGIGKTVFVREVQKQIIAAHGFFISGKFDQFNRGTPYHAFSQAFGVLARQLLAESEVVISRWKKKLLDQLGNNVGIINELVPEFELILGAYPPPVLLSPEETMNRFLYTWKVFFKTVASAAHPLILFLDDLQWSDLASLELIERLCSDSDIGWLCFIGSYRQTEVDELHPLIETAQKIEAHRPLHKIHLAELQEQDISALLGDVFYRKPTETTALARLLLKKTQGNPFFLVEALKTLYHGKGIYFDETNRKWHWDIQHIQTMDITDNVVDLMVEKIRKCSPEAQENLMLASCIGHQFSLRALSWISDERALPFLKEALDQGLIYPTDDHYLLLNDSEQRAILYQNHHQDGQTQLDAGFRFLHDRVQQAAYSQLSTDHRETTHLKLGQKLLEYTIEPEKSEHIFEICTHINLGNGKINDQTSKNHYAALNLIAGRKAITSNAYLPALDFLEHGIQLLPPDPWHLTYELSYELWSEVAQCHILMGQIEQAEAVLNDVLAQCQSRLHQLGIYRKMVEMYTTQLAHAKVLATVQKSLKLFKVRMPQSPVEAQFRIVKDLLGIQFKLRNTNAEDILNFPLSDNPEHIELSGIVLKAGPSAYISNQNLFAWMVLFEVRRAIKLGTTPFSPLGYLGYGMILHKAFGNLDAAFAYAGAALKLNEQMGNPLPIHVLKFTFFNFVHHFREDVLDAVDISKQLHRVALEAGDQIYAGFFLSYLIWNAGVKGKDLKELCQEGTKYLKVLEQQKDINGYDLLLTRLSSLLVLSGQESIPWKINGVEVSIEEKRAQFRAEQSYTQLAISYLSSFQLSYLLKDQPIYIAQILEADQYMSYLEDTYIYTDYALMMVMAGYKFYRENGTHKRQVLRIMRKHQQQMKRRAKNNPVNYECHYLLIASLLARIQNKKQATNKLLEATVKSAKKRGFNHLSAMAQEVLARNYIADGQPQIAKFYLRGSIHAYQQWGAVARVEQLLQKHPDLLLETVSLGTELGSKTILQNSSSGTNYDLNLESLMKSARSISSEIVLEKLLPAMIYIAVENAGAQSGYLLLNKNGQLFLSAYSEIEQAQGRLLEDIPINGSDKVPTSIINYTYRTQEPLVIDFLGNDDRFSDDPYFIGKEAKSIICYPLLHLGQLKGVIYLENNLIFRAFGEKQTKVLNILSTQIAVSLQNAMLYNDLEKSLDQQIKLTEAYGRFTPKEYLRFLGRESILDAQLGDNRHAEMIVLFCDIRSYTTISEQMTPEENFLFMSTYHHRMSGFISKNNGMINQLLGDGIMAFFFNSEDAVKASVEIQLELLEYNRERYEKGRKPVKVGVGLHKGPVIIGIVGNENRMGITISSDTVNTASRVEGLTKYYGANILLSKTVAQELSATQMQSIRRLGEVKVKGKSKTLDLLECFAGDPPVINAKKSSHQALFQVGQQHYFQQDFEKAIAIFRHICNGNPDDLPARWHLKKAEHYKVNGVPDDWMGVEDMAMK